MDKEIFYYDKNIEFDKKCFEEMFSRITEGEIGKPISHIRKIFFLSDWTELEITKDYLLKQGQTEEEVNEFIWQYSSDFWRGLCFYKEGIIILNFMEIINSADYYCSQSQYRNVQDFRKFIVQDSRFNEIEKYVHDNKLVRQLIFWKTLFHEIRHVEQHYYPECQNFKDDEKDADEYGVYIYKTKIEPIQRDILKIDLKAVNV